MKSRIVPTTIVVAALWLVFAIYGCQGNRAVTQTFNKEVELKKVAVMPYYVVRPPAGSVMVRSPLSNEMYRTGPIDPEAPQIMTGLLREQLAGKPGYAYVPRSEVPDSLQEMFTQETINFKSVEIPKLGQKFDADGILIGFIYVFKDRQGTGFSVDSPASVTFDLYLLDAGVGRILWKGNYSKTQQAITDNLLDMSGGLRWLKATELARHGLQSMFETYPGIEGLKK